MSRLLPSETPESLALESLGREFAELTPEEQNVIRRVASRSFIGLDADERAQAQSSRWDLLADRVAAIGGSWGFILTFGLVLVTWVLLNNGVLEWFGLAAFDAYPFIFLNLLLSMLAAAQAPIILMSQNRQSAKDRIAARHDYEVNLRTQLEIRRLYRRVDQIARKLDK